VEITRCTTNAVNGSLDQENGDDEDEAVTMGRVTVRRPVLRVDAKGERSRPDALAAEEPLELRVDGRALAVTMRTPGHDVELAHGFLLTEGVIGSPEDVSVARYCDGTDDEGRNTYNVLDVTLAEGVPPPQTGVERNFYTTSSCGVCGKAALDAVRLSTRHSPAGDPVEISPEVLATLPNALREQQKVFAATGGLHGAGLFTAEGEPLVVREDVGRHNAVDKVLGKALLDGRIPATRCCWCPGGRRSSWCRRRRWPACRCSRPCPHRRRWPSSWPRSRA
jgi:FdhD protein